MLDREAIKNSLTQKRLPGRLTLSIRVQALVRTWGGVGESVTVDDGGVRGHGSLGYSTEIRIGVVDVEKAKSLREAGGPLQVVHQGPGCVAPDIHTIQQVSWAEGRRHWRRAKAHVRAFFWLLFKPAQRVLNINCSWDACFDTFQHLVEVFFVVVTPLSVVQVDLSPLWYSVFCDDDGRISVLLFNEIQNFSEPEGGNLQPGRPGIQPASISNCTCTPEGDWSGRSDQQENECTRHKVKQNCYLVS